MSKNEILTRELTALGEYYRNDWSDFDGRSLRWQLDNILIWFNDPEATDFTQYSEMLKEQEEGR